MIIDVSDALSWLRANPKVIVGIRRGIEREGLRINIHGGLAQTPHPKSFGSALTHKWITTDFAEALMEFITPVNDNFDHTMILLRDIHRYVARCLEEERLWPMSMPCYIEHANSIKLARYGSSNIGRMKTVYRTGLKNRYSALMQIISGVHYNFSLPIAFWQSYIGISNEISGKEAISAGYLRLIRNYYRFGWIIPYLFGSSPGVCVSFLKETMTNMSFRHTPLGFAYLPYATSLRLSNLGYTNKLQSQLDITFNYLDEYIHIVKQAAKTSFRDYQRIGLQRNGRYLQLNTNILQIENELYTLIRPKRTKQDHESPSDALIRGGIEYVEVRSLDVNPFSPIGIDEEQARFLDLFLIWCVLADSPNIDAEELLRIRKNWNKVVLKGRKPGLVLTIGYNNQEQPLIDLIKLILIDLKCIAEIIDSNNENTKYQDVCDRLTSNFSYSNITLSARLLDQLIEHGVERLGLMLANDYYKMLRDEPLEIFKESQLNAERMRSLQRQSIIEASDNLNFDDFLKMKNIR